MTIDILALPAFPPNCVLLHLFTVSGSILTRIFALVANSDNFKMADAAPRGRGGFGRGRGDRGRGRRGPRRGGRKDEEKEW